MDVFSAIMGGLLILAIAVLGGGFAWLHIDLGEIRTTSAEIGKHVEETRVELIKEIGGVREQAVMTNAKLDTLISEAQRHR